MCRPQTLKNRCLEDKNKKRPGFLCSSHGEELLIISRTYRELCLLFLKAIVRPENTEEIKRKVFEQRIALKIYRVEFFNLHGRKMKRRFSYAILL